MKAETSSSSTRVKTILVVDERDSSRLLTKWFLSSFGFAVDSARSADEALALFELKVHDVVITDHCVSELCGQELAQFVKGRSPRTRVVLFSSTIPTDPSGCDVFVARPGHLLLLKNALDEISARPECCTAP